VSIFFRPADPRPLTMSQPGVPALEVSNGFVRVGSLVRIKAGDAKVASPPHCGPGAVMGFSAPDHTVTIRLEGGDEVTVGAADVARQSPHPIPTACPSTCLYLRSAPSARARACGTPTLEASSGRRRSAGSVRERGGPHRPRPPWPHRSPATSQQRGGALSRPGSSPEPPFPRRSACSGVKGRICLCADRALSLPFYVDLPSYLGLRPC